jgi:hypothetical protein
MHPFRGAALTILFFYSLAKGSRYALREVLLCEAQINCRTIYLEGVGLHPGLLVV